MTEKHGARSDCVLIKRYAGRRLYHTVNATYVTRDDLANMILAGERFTVREAETGTDITRIFSTGCIERKQHAGRWGIP